MLVILQQMQQSEEANIGRGPGESDAEGIDISTDEEGGGEGHSPPEEADICSDFCHGVTAVHCQRGDHSRKPTQPAAEALCGGRVTTRLPQSAAKDLVVQLHREAVASLGCQLLEARADAACERERIQNNKEFHMLRRMLMEKEDAIGRLQQTISQLRVKLSVSAGRSVSPIAKR